MNDYTAPVKVCGKCHYPKDLCDCGPTGPVPGSSVASRYAWRDENRLKRFATWEEEIAHMESLGYKLVAPEYLIPHWREKMRAGESAPTLYVMRNDGPDKLSANFNRYAAELGYPVFYRTNTEMSQPKG